jgi:hypothetical protein
MQRSYLTVNRFDRQTQTKSQDSEAGTAGQGQGGFAPRARGGQPVGRCPLANGESTTDIAYGFAASPEREGQIVTADYPR